MDWISVKNRLPEPCVKVLVWLDRCGGDINIGRYNTSGNLPYWAVGGAMTCYNVTHWMPMPEPPKED